MATTPLDLLGRWPFERTVEDRFAGERLLVTGEAVLAPTDDGGVRWHEEGLLRRRGSPSAAVRRTLLLRPVQGDVAGWLVTFDDGRPFHAWTPGTEVEHPCGPDRYRGVVGPPGADGTWRVTWVVRGPAKDHTITTDYGPATAPAVPSGSPSGSAVTTTLRR